jgi:hypothetical protein
MRNTASDSFHPRGRAARLSALVGLLAIGLASPAWAGRPVRVYEASVRGSEAAAPEAMREVLVRATGRRDAGNDPALSDLVTNAARYVRSSRTTDGVSQFVFDGAAIERDVDAAGRSVWNPERPFTIVVLSPPLSGPAADSARRALEEIGEARGLPVALLPMAIADGSGNELASDALLQSAQRLGGDAVLLGRTDGAPPSGATPSPAGAPPSGSWQWTLLTDYARENWTGSFEAGVNGAADALARVQGETQQLPEADALVQVSGVATLADYAAVERVLSELPGVRRSGLEEAAGTTATFRVLIRGGADAVAHALASSPRLSQTGSADARLTYQLRAQ